MNPPTRFSATVPSVTFSAKLISRDADLFVGCADDVDQQEQGDGMKVGGMKVEILLCGARTIR